MKTVYASSLTMLRLVLLPALLLVGQSVLAVVGFTITPAIVSDQYTGSITYQITGLTNGETVRIGNYFDANTNGVVDGPDFHVFGMQVTDGKVTVIGGVTNLNVAGDWDTNSGSIQFQLRYPVMGIEQRMVGTYNYKLASTTGRFASITTPFTVTNSAYGQSLSGAVQCAGTNVPYAGILLFGGGADHSSPLAGLAANGAGNYSLKVPPGTYQVWAFKSNYVADMTTAPTVTVGAGATLTTNLNLLPATCSISGQYVYPNLTQGVSGLLVVLESTNNQTAIGFTDTNGYFTIPVVAGEWKLSNDDQALPGFGLLDLQNYPRVDITSVNQTAPAVVMPAGGALFYGTITDNLGNPLTGVELYADDDGNQYEAPATTDQNGYYTMAVKGGNWKVSAGSSSPGFANYSFSDDVQTNINGAQAVRVDFRGMIGTNHISGYVKNSTNGPIAGVDVWCDTASPINGINYHAPSANTDNNGYYSFNIPNGTWTVQPACDDGSGLTQLGYQCVNSVNVVVSNNNIATNFIVPLPPSQISGTVRDSNNNPVANLGLTAYANINGVDTYVNGGTDGSGHYALSVANGSWDISLLCCGNNSLSQLGYLCVSDQVTNVVNSAAVVNFTVPAAPYHVSGYLRDTGSDPIPNVDVYIDNADYHMDMCPATTDGSGHYSFFVTNGNWSVSVDCSELGALGYLCPNGITVGVAGADVSTNFIMVQAPFQLSGWLKDGTGNPIQNMDVYAYATISGQDYWLDSFTDSNGNYSNRLAAGVWHIGVNCGGDSGLTSQGYDCVAEQMLTVSANVTMNFTATVSTASLQVTTTSLPNATQNAAYRATLTAFGGQPPYTWSLTPGSASLPYYLTLSTNGTISGIPASAGSSSFFVRVRDAAASTVDQFLTLTVVASTNKPVLLLTAAKYSANGQFQFTVNTAAGVNYRLEVSSDLKSWAPALTFTGSGGPLTLGDVNTIGTSQRFYRVRVGP